jgi:hypothetical protein
VLPIAGLMNLKYTLLTGVAPDAASRELIPAADVLAHPQ